MVKEIKKYRLLSEFNKVKNDIKYLSYPSGIVGRLRFVEIFILESGRISDKLYINNANIYSSLGINATGNDMNIFDDAVIDIISHLIKHGKENLIIEHNVGYTDENQI